MKLKNVSKLMPLCLLFSLTACGGLSTVETRFLGSRVEITITNEKTGYLREINRIFKELEQYGDPENIKEIMKKCHSSNNKYCLSDNLDLFRMLMALLENARDSDRKYTPHDNGYRDLWKNAMLQGRPLNTNEEMIGNELLSELSLYNSCFNFAYPEYEMSYRGDFTFDLRPIIESYALGKIRDYCIEYIDEYCVRTSSDNMYVFSKYNPKSVAIMGPYGKEIIINGLNEAFISKASCTKTITLSNGSVVSPDYIDYNGPYVYNDCVITVNLYSDRYGVVSPVTGAAYAYGDVKTDFASYEGLDDRGKRLHVYTIVFKNGTLAYCSDYLDAIYDGVRVGSGRINW